MQLLVWQQKTGPQIQLLSHTCFTDGSWKGNWVGGTGFVLEFNGELVAYGSHCVSAGSALQAEAMALLHGCEYVRAQLGITSCSFSLIVRFW